MSFFSKLSSSAQGPPSSLPPAPYALGVFGQYCVHQTETVFKLTENRMSFSGDDFKIRTAAGQDVFRCEAKVMSLHDRKKLLEASGLHLFTVLRRRLHIHATFDGVDPQDDDKQLFRVKSHFSMGGAKMSVTFKNLAHEGEEVVFELKGSFFDRSAEIVWNGQPVARIARQFLNLREAFFDKDTYYLSIAPGCDAAMLVAVCICLDEIRNDEK